MDLDVTVASSSPTWHTVLDIVGDLLANRCQVKKLLSTGLRLFRQVAETLPLRPEDNQPNPGDTNLQMLGRSLSTSCSRFEISS